MPRIRKLHGTPDERQIWRVVDGAVATMLHAHPEYFTERGLKKAREALNKRVAQQISAYLAQAGWSRSGVSPARESVRESALTPAGDVGVAFVP